jgi:hypothetical protein
MVVVMKHQIKKIPSVGHWGVKERPFRLLIISDLHVGSITALCSEKPVVSDHNSYHLPNKLQKALFKAWKDMIKDATKDGGIDLLVVNGECIDGANVKQVGQQSWTTNLDDQMNDAKKLIEMIPYKKILLIRGSNYHDQLDATNLEEIMASKLRDVVDYKTYGGEGKTDYFAYVKINGKIFNFTHHIGYSRQEGNRANALSREMKGMHFQHDKLGRSDFMVRSHVHYFVHVEFTNTHGIVTPCWKYPDAHLTRGGLAGTTPDIGAVWVDITKDGGIFVDKFIAEIGVKPRVIDFDA